WRRFSLFGMKPVDAAEPVCHVSYYEADAFARWAGARLPTEAEWEAAANEIAIADGPDEPPLCPQPLPPGARGLAQLDRDVWQWTALSQATKHSPNKYSTRFVRVKLFGGFFGSGCGKRS